MNVPRRAVTVVLALAAAVWGGTVVLAVGAIRRFESTPGLAADARSRWPSASQVAPEPVTRGSAGATLVMLIHPHCSCSRASVQELAAVLEKAPRSMRTYVLVYRPHEFAAGWEETGVYRAALALPRTNVVLDVDGREAKRFGGFTSGQTFLYGQDGALRFAGGITSLRGHAGANRGSAELIRLAGSRTGSGTHPVFGCAISSRTEGESR
jgi:hypothetical protein